MCSGGCDCTWTWRRVARTGWLLCNESVGINQIIQTVTCRCICLLQGKGELVPCEGVRLNKDLSQLAHSRAVLSTVRKIGHIAQDEKLKLMGYSLKAEARERNSIADGKVQTIGMHVCSTDVTCGFNERVQCLTLCSSPF